MIIPIHKIAFGKDPEPPKLEVTPGGGRDAGIIDKSIPVGRPGRIAIFADCSPVRISMEIETASNEL